MDILFFALIAIVIAYKYYSILGKKDENFDDLEAKQQELQEKLKNFEVIFSKDNNVVNNDNIIEAKPLTTSSNEKIIEIFSRINNIYPEFNESFFRKGAESAFEIILENFSSGNIKKLNPLVNDHMLNVFKQDIDHRKDNNEQLNIAIIAIMKSDIVDAEIKDDIAYITVEFSTEQIVSLVDKDGNVISGNPKYPSIINDTWVFSKDLGSDGPEWQLDHTL